MASIRKSFNFRNGVQVDEDNFIVNANGLVGIGTSVPLDSLDVTGNIRCSNSILADNIEVLNSNFIGITTTNTLNVDSVLNVGFTSITSGIITSYTGVVTYYGDGGRLLNLPTSQWLDVDVGLGFTSIYAQGYVGVATDDPRYPFQIGGNYQNIFDLTTLTNGIGIGSDGNMFISGIVTATNFVGLGSLIDDVDANNITLGTLPNSRLADTVVVNNIDASGIITSGTYFDGSLVGIASTARDITSESTIQITGLNVGVATVTTTLTVDNSIGIGTNITDADLHIIKTGISSIRITGIGTGESSLILGSNKTGNDGNAEIRFGNTDSNYFYSSEQSLDILNYDDGNYNYYNNVSGGTGNYNWFRGIGIFLMTLTSDGRLGIGSTSPQETFEVVGTSTVTGNSFVGGDFSVNGNETISGNLTVGDIFSSGSIEIQGNIGIFTDNPTYSLQIGSDPLVDGGGVGLRSDGQAAFAGDIFSVRDINATGIITSTDGNIGGSLSVGSSITVDSLYALSGDGSGFIDLNASNISSGILDNARLPNDISIGGEFVGLAFSGDGSLITNLDASNISSGTLNNDRLPNEINISGILTASGFDGDGSDLTNLAAENISGTLDNTNLPADIEVVGVITSAEFVGIGSLLTELDASNIAYGTISDDRLPNDISIGGQFTGDGSLITNLDASNISSGTLNNARLPNEISISGILTASGFDGDGSDLTNLAAENISGTLDNSNLPTNLNVGIVSATDLSTDTGTTFQVTMSDISGSLYLNISASSTLGSGSTSLLLG